MKETIGNKEDEVMKQKREVSPVFAHSVTDSHCQVYLAKDTGRSEGRVSY